MAKLIVKHRFCAITKRATISGGEAINVFQSLDGISSINPKVHKDSSFGFYLIDKERPIAYRALDGTLVALPQQVEET